MSMARMFYLSLVYDANGYRRYDMLKRESLKELDSIISQFKNREEVLKAYFPNYEKGKQKGKVCIIYEDLDLKMKQLEEARGLSDEMQEKLKKNYDFAHIIPILYKNRRMIDINSCIYNLKARKNRWKTITAIMFNVVNDNGDVVAKTNKRYIFELGEEKRLIEEEHNYREALNWFIKRVEKSSYDDQYFYFRTLIDILHLSVRTIQTKIGKVEVCEENMKDSLITKWELEREMKYRDIMNEKDQLEEDAKDMESFYIIHDLDEVIKLSPNEKRPIGSSVRKGRK